MLHNLHSDVVTIFNWHERTQKWYTTTFQNAHVVERLSETATPQSGDTGNDGVDLSIPVSRDQIARTKIFELNLLSDGEGRHLVDGDGVLLAWTDPTTSELRVYVKPMVYASLADPSKTFTLKPETDFFVLADLWSADPLEDSGDEGLFSEMNATRDDVFMISSATYYKLIPHFEIAGR